MLKKRIIPIVLIDGYSVLKTISFETRRNQGNPITVARTYNSRNVDELIVLDIDASKQNRAIDLFTIQDIASECFMPLTVGGGIASIEDIEKCLKSGADKVCLNSLALEDYSFIKSASETFGAQCIVVSVDFKEEDSLVLYSHKSNSNLNTDLLEHIENVVKAGAGEILLTNATQEGQMNGISEKSIALLNEVSSSYDIPILYAGGVKEPEDCVKIINAGASASCSSSIFHFTRYTPEDCRKQLLKSGIPARTLG